MTFKELSKQFETPSQYLMFCYILSKQNEDGIACVKLRDMEADTNCSIRQIRSFLESLEKRCEGHVCNNRGNNGGNFVTIDNQLLKAVSETMVITKMITMKIASDEAVLKHRVTSTAHAKRLTPEDIARRQNEFYQTLVPYISQYGKEMIDAFYRYWGQSNTKTGVLAYEKAEHDKGWEVGMRLATWAKNNYSGGKESYNAVQQVQQVQKPVNERYEKFKIFLANDVNLQRFIPLIPEEKFADILRKYNNPNYIIDTLRAMALADWQGLDINEGFMIYGSSR